MSAFEPPTDASWCPECARERISCTHQDSDAVATDGGEIVEPGRHPVELISGFSDNEANPKRFTMVPTRGDFNPWTTFIRMDIDSTVSLRGMR